MTYSKCLICAGILFICVSFVFPEAPAFAGNKPSNIPEIDKLMLEAQKEVSEEEMAYYEQLPIEESSNDGYWWIKQTVGQKTSYVKDLIKALELDDKNFSADKIIKELDIVYNPKDNPLDIKMDKSVERMFSVIIKRIMAK